MKRLFYPIFALATLSLAQCNETKSMPTAEVAPEAPEPEKIVKMSDAEWKEKLSAEEYRILRQAGTERSFGAVYKEFEKQGKGTYYCVGCDAELFSSKEKFDSGSGWPSFYSASNKKNVKEVMETDGSGRVEVRCNVCDGHLGHVFSGEGYDNPTDQRFCINGTVLKYVPK